MAGKKRNTAISAMAKARGSGQAYERRHCGIAVVQAIRLKQDTS